MQIQTGLASENHKLAPLLSCCCCWYFKISTCLNSELTVIQIIRGSNSVLPSQCRWLATNPNCTVETKCLTYPTDSGSRFFILTVFQWCLYCWPKDHTLCVPLFFIQLNTPGFGEVALISNILLKLSSQHYCFCCIRVFEVAKVRNISTWTKLPSFSLFSRT